MAIAAAIILPIGLLFLLSGLIINFIQALLFILVRPCSKNIYIRINKEVTELLWLELIWLFDWWANVKVELYTDQETYDLMGKEDALVISNHRSDIDWLVGWVIAQVLGWSMWFSGYISLERSWAKDENTLKKTLYNVWRNTSDLWASVIKKRTALQQLKLKLKLFAELQS
ncbi:PREDICTED: 1-acyl-sn-glycerol-3-phosphate acyltransferase 3-like isoform X3 [Nicotiana attenuata]|uniref:1-acyl-sn-glycerol-3-phosphate acyltransferase 3-like isoform X3 n=1 Tax=Nicotiana attenuata TaxID=49451 RepID=UPI0009059B01|nr:PREDICTED: 1-acyl-sn-glycerol-3-phosphate acyltransferase 3-like isoform X3 [Nicotiana attenuata]